MSSHRSSSHKHNSDGDYNIRHYETNRKSNDVARWTTVGSDSEEDIRSNHKRSRSSSDSSSDDDRSSRHRKEKRDDKDREHKSSKKHSKHKKEKKHKHGKEHRSAKDSKSSSAVNQNEYGKYGIIKEEHYFQKQKEFEVYMDEVKHLPAVGSLSKREVMDYFKSYIEDYNTATMPHEKYYSYSNWENEKYHKEQERKLAASSRNPDFVYADDDDYGGSGIMNDEESRRKELLAARQNQQQREFDALKVRMAQSTDARDDMRRQEQLRGELQVAYRSGDTQAISRLERVLKPDDRVAAVRNVEKLLGNKGGW